MRDPVLMSIAAVKQLTKPYQQASSKQDKCQPARPLILVEITHVPKEDIDMVARTAKELGAKLVAVHGETIVEPVEPGTNEAAVRSASVDVLAHPGLITYEHARLAAENGVYLEVSARKGHSFTNGHVAKVALKAKAAMVLDSDAHGPEDLLTPELTQKIAMGAGLNDADTHALLELNPQALLARLGFGPKMASPAKAQPS